MPLPIAHGLVGASIIVASRRKGVRREDWWPLLVGAVLAVSPDFDLLFDWGLGISPMIHGGPTHSVLFAVPLGVLGALLAREFNRRGVAVFFAIAVSHGLLDFVTKREFGGAQLFWPFSAHKFRLDWFSYYEFYPAPGIQPLGEMIGQALQVSYYEVLTFVPLFVAVLVWKRWLGRRAL